MFVNGRKEVSLGKVERLFAYSLELEGRGRGAREIKESAFRKGGEEEGGEDISGNWSGRIYSPLVEADDPRTASILLSKSMAATRLRNNYAGRSSR